MESQQRKRGFRMTRMTKLLLTTGALALGGAAFAGASLADGGWGRHHGQGYGHGGGGERLFESFDANGDGRLTQAEVDQVRQARLAEFDSDGDGSLTLEEYQALWLDAMRERMVDQFQAHDDDGDGKVTVAEFDEPYSRIIVRLDANGDGEVTMEELRERGERYRRGRDGDRPGGDGEGDRD